MSSNTGALGDQYTYSAFGEIGEEGPGGNPFRYTGRRLDAETGLYYYRARYYSPTLGRFLQTDPIGYKDQMNLYTYVANDPVNNRDPGGLVRVCTDSAGSRLKSCVDANGDGDTSDSDLTSAQMETLSNDFRTFIRKNNGRDISSSGAAVIGEDNEQTSFIRATSQFVGDARGGWDGITIQMGDTNLIRYASRDQSVDSETRAYWIAHRRMIAVNTDAPSTFVKAGNAGRTLIHELLHPEYPLLLNRRGHRELDAEARALLRSYGLGDGGCESIGGIFGLFPTYPACD